MFEIIKVLNFYMIAINKLNLYIHSLSFFFAFKDGILNNTGIIFNPNGYSIDMPKLINVSLIKII
jgi:hypothetical protein